MLFALLPNSLSLISSGVAIVKRSPTLGFHKISYKTPSKRAHLGQQAERNGPCHLLMTVSASGVHVSVLAVCSGLRVSLRRAFTGCHGLSE